MHHFHYYLCRQLKGGGMEIIMKNQFTYNVQPFINDLVIKEDLCNMKCEYCLTNTSTFTNSSKGINKEEITYREGSSLKYRLDKLSESMSSYCQMGILKVSGGEILLIEGIIDYISNESRKYKAVQLLTNGLLLDQKKLEKLKQIDNLCIQISLDHSDFAGNEYRIKSFKNLNKILENIDSIIQMEIPLEINCVLSNKNTGTLSSFLEYLRQYDKKLMVFPFPVRGKNRKKYLPDEGQIKEINRILNSYELYEGILPPKIYISYLYDFLKNNKRKIPCYITKISFGSFDTGEITPCANYWFTSVGNLLKEDKKTVCSKLGTDKLYKILNSKHQMMKQCVECYTPWELINFYFNDLITIDELSCIPLYKIPGIKELFINAKRRHKCEKNRE